MRGAVAQALGRIGDASAPKEVLALTKDKDSIVAGFALVAAGRLKLAAAQPAMLDAFKGGDAHTAGEALGYLSEHAPLFAALATTDAKQWLQREGAIQGLAASGDDKAFEAVSAALAKPQVNGGLASAAAAGFVNGHVARGAEPLTKAREQLKKAKNASRVEVLDRAIADLGLNQ